MPYVRLLIANVWKNREIIQMYALNFIRSVAGCWVLLVGSRIIAEDPYGMGHFGASLGMDIVQ